MIGSEQQTVANIATHRASRVPVDHNGRPVGAAKTYTYDSAGHLVAAAEQSPEGADGHE